ncbi:hypothetical protein [Limnobacter parvus]|uniref:Uncharacterized protein n=1 Tax=Limnobacter parvus TaxID=2939690 RepID=A0ABT1XFY8_9BURK|nr:hypothetical protein [Limnobacter parvus]MCR2746198.1 hypothetical protein [Limnobacter parvus]
MVQAEELREQLESNPHNIALIPEIEEIKLIIQSLLAELPAMPRGKIVATNGADLYEGLTSNLHYFLSHEIDLKAMRALPEIARSSVCLNSAVIDIDALMKHIEAEQKFEELKTPSRELIENALRTYALNPNIQTLKLENIITNSYNRVHQIQRALKNYAYFDSVAEQCDKFFVSQRHLIPRILEKVEECYQQTMEIQPKSFVKMIMQDGAFVEIENKDQADNDHHVFVKLLPKIEELSELGISTLAHLIETASESQHPLHTEQRLLRQLNDLCYFTEKFSWAIRELCAKEGLQDLLVQATEDTTATDDSITLNLNASLGGLTIDNTKANIVVDSTIEPTHEERLELRTKRTTGLLEKCGQILAINPIGMLESVQRNPGFYSPATVMQIYRVFTAQSLKVCGAASSAKSRIERELQHSQLSPEIRTLLESHSNRLSELAKNLEQEMHYAATDDFKFSVLKQHRTPRAESWATLVEHEQLDSISLKPKLPSADRDDHLYEFELAPKSDSSGKQFPSVWLHVHLNKNLHKPAQWQSLEQADVKAAHLKPDHARNLGAKWQEAQRALGNYNTVVERSRVNIEFIKLVASKVEATAEQSKNHKKSKSRRK